jgi:tRNA pseudouridine55 synthase
VATLLLGLTTDTEDVTGETITESDNIPTESEVLSVIGSFVGSYMQTPPMYSALKVGGKKLCDLAREGITVEREAREVSIHSLTAERISEREYTLDVYCSKGTYIRTLCADIGAKLGCGGCMKTLCRASASGFTLADAHTLGELEAMSESEREESVFPVEYIFRNLDEVKLSPFFSKLAHSGLEIYLKKIGINLSVGTRVRLSDDNGFFALGEVREYEEGNAIKPIRQF